MMSKASAWMAKRGISQQTLDHFGVIVGDDVITYPYFDWNGDRVGAKHRGPNKKIWSDTGSRQILYAQIEALQSDKPLVIVEGEQDALAVYEAGYFAVASVPNGAPDKAGNLGRYSYIREAWDEGLDPHRTIIIAVDEDGPGAALREDLVAVFGPANCRLVRWPEGIKDANEMLIKDGPEALLDLIVDGSIDYPVEGVYTMEDLPEPSPLEKWLTGFPEIEDRIALCPTLLSVVTGHPGHGKSQLMLQTWCQIAVRYDIKVGIFSGELPAKPFLRRAIRQYFMGKRESAMSDAEIAQADLLIQKHWVLIQPPQKPTVESILELAEYAAVKHGIRALVVDPWNKLEQARERDERETDYIGRALDDFIALARRFKIHVQIIAHPAKSNDLSKKSAPNGEHIAASKNWDNRPDQILVVHRPEVVREDGSRATEAQLIQRKARFEEVGYPCIMAMNFDLDRQVYTCTEYETRLEKGLRDG